MQCSGLEPCRQALSERLEAALPYAGAPGAALARFRKQGAPAFSKILGGQMEFPVCPPGRIVCITDLITEKENEESTERSRSCWPIGKTVLALPTLPGTWIGF